MFGQSYGLLSSNELSALRFLIIKAENIYFKSTNPPTISDENSEGGRVGTIVGVTSTKVYVPRNSVEQYKAITHLNTREIIGYDFE